MIYVVNYGTPLSGVQLNTLNSLVGLPTTPAGFAITKDALGNFVNTPISGSGQTAIQFQDEGINLGAPGTVDTINFVGSGVTASRVGNAITVSISGGGGSGETVSWSVNQTAHGFVVGDVVRSNGTANQYTKAQANSAANAEVIGIVTAVASANSFTITSHGRITTGVPTATAGTVFFLSASTAGALTSTQPSGTGEVSLPILTIIQSGASAFLNLRRGLVITPSGGGSGDVVGPASSTDNALARFDGTTGKIIQNSLGTLDDSGNLNVVAAIISGTNGAGHINLRHQASDASATGQTTSLFADANGDIKWKNAGNFYTTLRTSPNTADRVYTFPNANGDLAFKNTIVANEIAYAVDANTFGSLTTATYPSLAELAHVKGVTSAIQTQINGKQDTITGGATTITSANLTASRALISNASGKVAVSSVTDTELGYVSGVTSPIQTQINSKQNTGNYITALIGDVTATGPGSVTATIANGAVTYAKMQNATAGSILLGRGNSGAGAIQEITLGSGLTMTGTVLSATGGGVTDGNKGDITVSGSGATWTINAGAVVYADIQNVSANTFLANATGSSATVQEIATNRIPLFASAITGTPSSTTFLRGDGTWATPAGGGGSPGGVSGELQINNAGAFGGADVYRNTTAIEIRQGTTAQQVDVFRTWATSGTDFEGIRLHTTTGVTSSVWGQVLARSGGTGSANVNIAITPRGTGAISAQIADGTSAGGNIRGTNAVDFQMSRANATQVASGIQAFIGSGASNGATAQQSAVVSGSTNIASGTRAFIGAGGNNNASGQDSVISGGNQNAASASHASVVGGQTNTASGMWSTVGGYQNTASGAAATAFGVSNNASGQAAWIPGGESGSTRSVNSKFAWGSGGYIGLTGSRQIGGFTGFATSTNATPVNITAGGASASASTTDTLPSNIGEWVYRFKIYVTALSASDYKSWEIQGFIRRNGAASTTALLGTPIKTVIMESAGATSWDCNAVANTTAGSLVAQGTGVAATTIWWLCEHNTQEMIRL